MNDPFSEQNSGEGEELLTGPDAGTLFPEGSAAEEAVPDRPVEEEAFPDELGTEEVLPEPLCTDGDLSAETPALTPEEKKKAFRRELLSWLAWLLIPVLTVLLLNSFVIKLVRVSGISMYPTLHDRDVIIVWQLSEPKQGDIVVFKHESVNLVKRMIAGEGQTLEIDYENNTVYVDGVPLKEDYVNPNEADRMEEKAGSSFFVTEHSIFVMGDNRNHSADSRSALGCVDLDTVYGPMILRIPLGVLLEWAENLIGR